MSGGARTALIVLGSAAAGAIVFAQVSEPSSCCGIVADGIRDRAVAAAGGGPWAVALAALGQRAGLWRGLVGPVAFLRSIGVVA